MAKKFPLHPKHPERICWGCDKYCSTDNMLCGNGSSRTQHPMELLGEDWYEFGDWGIEVDKDVTDPSAALPVDVIGFGFACFVDLPLVSAVDRRAYFS